MTSTMVMIVDLRFVAYKVTVKQTTARQFNTRRAEWISRVLLLRRTFSFVALTCLVVAKIWQIE
jgi:hypothetical protein